MVSLFLARSLKVPFHWRSAWYRALGYIANMDFVVTHIYREGNYVANYLASRASSLVCPLDGGPLNLLFHLLFTTIVL